MRQWLEYVAVGSVVLLLTLQPSAATGAEVHAFMTIAVQNAVENLIAVFEKSSGHHITPLWAVAAALNKRIQDGEPADVLISTRAGIDGLIKSGKIVVGSDAVVAQVGMGIGIRKGAPKPDISTPEALKRTLLAAKKISYSDPAAGGVSGVHFATVLERLGIANEMKAKTTFPPASGFAATLVANGQADLAIQQISELRSVEGVDVAGPLPGDLQLITTFAAGVPANAKQPDAGRAFLRFLQTPQAVAMMKSKGLNVPGR